MFGLLIHNTVFYQLTTSQLKILLILAFTDSRKLKMRQAINNEMDHGENVRILKTLGFGEAKIRRVLTQIYEELDNNFYNFNDFLQALLDVPEDRQMTVAEARKIVEEGK